MLAWLGGKRKLLERSKKHLQGFDEQRQRNVGAPSQKATKRSHLAPTQAIKRKRQATGSASCDLLLSDNAGAEYNAVTQDAKSQPTADMSTVALDMPAQLDPCNSVRGLLSMHVDPAAVVLPASKINSKPPKAAAAPTATAAAEGQLMQPLGRTAASLDFLLLAGGLPGTCL